MSEKTTLVKAECIHCNQDIIGPKDSFDEVWNAHLDNCDNFKTFVTTLKELHEKGLLQSMGKLIKIEQIEKSLKRLIKKHKVSPEELIEILETFRVEEE